MKFKIPEPLLPLSDRIRILLHGEPAPAPGPGVRGVRRPVPVPKEPILSVRRMLIGLEAAILVVTCMLAAKAWRLLAGNWPAAGNFRPPEVVRFVSPADVEVERGRVWIIGASGLILVEASGRTTGLDDLTRPLRSRVVTAVVPARGGGAWIATTRGIARYSDGEGVVLPDLPAALKEAHATAVAEDDRGRLWVATTGEGLFRLAGGQWRQYREELPTPYVTCLAPADGGRVWVGLFAGGLSRTDGESWEHVRDASWIKGKSVLRLAGCGEGRALAVTESGLYRVESPRSWTKVDVPGVKNGEEIAKVVAIGGRADPGSVRVLTRAGKVIDPALGALALGGGDAAVQAFAAAGAAAYFLRDGVLFRQTGGLAVPLTNWAGFTPQERYVPPVPDVPLDWTDPRYRDLAGRLALAALLAVLALSTRTIRWRLTGPAESWRVVPLALPALAAGCALLGVLYLSEKLGWVATSANEIVWMPVMALFALWLFAHWMRVIVHEWRLRENAFWLGLSLVLSLTGGWLWWARVALVPGLIVCAVAGFFFAQGLKGLGKGNWRRWTLAWGGAAFVFQAGAVLPPLLFAMFMMDWGRGALSMFETAPIFDRAKAEEIVRPPSRFVWSRDGMRAAYVHPSGHDSAVALVDGDEAEWAPRLIGVPTPEVFPSFSPDSSHLSFCYRTGSDALVELCTVEGKRRWRARIPGVPAPGWQPVWLADSSAMIVLTYARAGTHVWRVDPARGDAEKLFTSPQVLSWPSLREPVGAAAKRGEPRGRMACAVRDGSRVGLASVDLESQRVALIAPAMHAEDPSFVFDPTPEGKAVIKFLRNTRDALRGGLGKAREGIHWAFKFFGWHLRLPEFWIRWPWHDPPVFDDDDFWRNYTAVRETTLAADGKSLACIARHAGGEEHVLHMLEGGGSCQILYRGDGRLTDLRWAAYKNRILVVESGRPDFSPAAVRRLIMISGLEPGKYTGVSARPMAPFAFWSGAGQFSPDGCRVVFAACDEFWRPRVTISRRYVFFEALMERVGTGADVGAALTGEGG